MHSTTARLGSAHAGTRWREVQGMNHVFRVQLEFERNAGLEVAGIRGGFVVGGHGLGSSVVQIELGTQPSSRGPAKRERHCAERGGAG
jgi:hypothetical protein